MYHFLVGQQEETDLMIGYYEEPFALTVQKNCESAQQQTNSIDRLTPAKCIKFSTEIIPTIMYRAYLNSNEIFIDLLARDMLKFLCEIWFSDPRGAPLSRPHGLCLLFLSWRISTSLLHQAPRYRLGAVRQPKLSSRPELFPAGTPRTWNPR
jgi:hypothetical protein